MIKPYEVDPVTDCNVLTTRLPDDLSLLVLYHGTTTSFGPRIMQDGLQPKDVTGRSVDESF